MKVMNLFFLATILVGLGNPTTSTASGDELDRIVAARDRVASTARETKGFPRANLDIERVRLNRLIADLEAGRVVDSMAIDEELRRAKRLVR